MYQVSQRYSYFSWWWAHSRPKHVEKINKHTKKNYAPSWLYLQVSGLFRDVWLPICSLGRWTAVLADFWDLIFRGRCRYCTLTPVVTDSSSVFDSFTLSNLSIQLCSYEPSVLWNNNDMNVCFCVWEGGGCVLFSDTGICCVGVASVADEWYTSMEHWCNDTYRMNLKYWKKENGPGYRSRYSDSLRVGRSVDRIPVTAIFSTPVQTGLGVHQTSYTMGTWSLSRGYSSRGLAVTTHLI
jgi:hypothetical protein